MSATQSSFETTPQKPPIETPFTNYKRPEPSERRILYQKKRPNSMLGFKLEIPQIFLLARRCGSLRGFETNSEKIAFLALSPLQYEETNTRHKGDTMYYTTIAAKLLGQLESFWGRISPHFHKPAVRFIGDMVFWFMAEKDMKLSFVVRALGGGNHPRKRSRTGEFHFYAITLRHI